MTDHIPNTQTLLRLGGLALLLYAAPPAADETPLPATAQSGQVRNAARHATEQVRLQALHATLSRAGEKGEFELERLHTRIGRIESLMQKLRAARQRGLKEGFPVAFAGRPYPDDRTLQAQARLLDSMLAARRTHHERLQSEMALLNLRKSALDWRMKVLSASR